MSDIGNPKQKISKTTYDSEEAVVRTGLLAAQRELANHSFPVAILIGGIEGAGKGEVINKLNEWMDARGIATHAFWDSSDEEQERPGFWRFWQKLPPKSTTAIMLGAWYSEPILDNAFGRLGKPEYKDRLHEISTFEQLLTDDGALIVKLWFHLSRKVQKKRLKRDRKTGRHSALLQKHASHYKAIRRSAERALKKTDSSQCAWHVVNGRDRRGRNLSAGKIVLAALESRLTQTVVEVPAASRSKQGTVTLATPSLALEKLDSTCLLSREEYERRLSAAQHRLQALGWQAHQEQRNAVCVFEGWDAAGKGGAIRRISAAIDSRLARVISISAPTEEERAQHYLWRFWRQIPRAGHCTIYDRSWYGRVLVERVENFCSQAEWSRAYREINEFERQLADSGTIIAKYWLHITPDEQLRRFEERQRMPWKRHKITDEDWRNRQKWEPYCEAINEMFDRTHTQVAPWTLVAANNKRFARVMVLETLCDAFEAALESV